MTRRAIALILVLLVLVLATTAAAAAAHLSIAARSRQTVSDRTRLAHTLLVAADDRIQIFLTTHSARVVLPPDSSEPSTPVAHDTLTLGSAPCTITITAYDQCGMVPWGLARPGSPLRAALPADIARAWDTTASRAVPGGSLGLDQFEPSGDPASHAVFPTSARGSPTAGTLIATHNPNPADHSGPTLSDAGLINVNTAPRALLERALRATGSSGLDEVLGARSRGQLAAAPPAAPGNRSALRLASQSDCWSFRVDIHVSSARQAWWCTYRPTGPTWRCIQRALVTD